MIFEGKEIGDKLGDFCFEALRLVKNGEKEKAYRLFNAYIEHLYKSKAVPNKGEAYLRAHSNFAWFTGYFTNEERKAILDVCNGNVN